jgi:hypothetical protein
VEDIVFFGETHEDWLRKYLTLPNRTPSADTILRVVSRIDRRRFEECFLSWTCGYFRERVSAGSVIPVDGKTVRGSMSEDMKKPGNCLKASGNRVFFSPIYGSNER